ncbi:MAG: hypothetical protein IJ705_04365 [Oscillospiraceae bacterium]|nr:hypothetical protein [Oscillospiraceae bacterium]
MKKALSLTLALALCLCLCIPAFADGAALSPQKLEADGQAVDCEVYNIDGYNYFKLRDIAKLMNGTGSQFEVGYDAEAGVVAITTGKAYTEVGGELEKGEDKSATAAVSPQTIQIDGETVDTLSVYNIGGNNFFKLRDLGAALNFDVDYNEETATMIVTSKAAEGGEGGDTAETVTAYVVSKETGSVDGKVDVAVTYSDFDEYGNPKTRTDVDGDETTVNTLVYTYDANGNITKRVRTSETGYTNTLTYEYDAKGNTVKEDYEDADISISTAYEYDANGFLVKETSTVAGGTTTTTVYENNEYGDAVKISLTTEEETLTYECAYEYDAEGNATKMTATFDDGTADVTTYEYDANGNLVKMVVISDGVEFATVYEYVTVEVKA